MNALVSILLANLVLCDQNDCIPIKSIDIDVLGQNVYVTYYECSDGLDNDEDGLTDLEDPDCLDYPRNDSEANHIVVVAES